MSQQPPSLTASPETYAWMGIVFVAVAVWPLSNTNESTMFTVIGVMVLAAGGYCLGAGAVARGVLMAKRHEQP